MEHRCEKNSKQFVGAAPLRQFARLEKSTYLVGQGNKFEIWDEALWNSKCIQWLESESDEGGLSEELERISL